MTPPTEPGPSLPPEIDSHYAAGTEAGRLALGPGRLEFARTQEVLRRCLPPPPAVVADVGGGPRPYARWLPGLGDGAPPSHPPPPHLPPAATASPARPT